MVTSLHVNISGHSLGTTHLGVRYPIKLAYLMEGIGPGGITSGGKVSYKRITRISIERLKYALVGRQRHFISGYDIQENERISQDGGITQKND